MDCLYLISLIVLVLQDKVVHNEHVQDHKSKQLKIIKFTV